jgi:hypothetical protein
MLFALREFPTEQTRRSSQRSIGKHPVQYKKKPVFGKLTNRFFFGFVASSQKIERKFMPIDPDHDRREPHRKEQTD